MGLLRLPPKQLTLIAHEQLDSWCRHWEGDEGWWARQPQFVLGTRISDALASTPMGILSLIRSENKYLSIERVRRGGAEAEFDGEGPLGQRPADPAAYTPRKGLALHARCAGSSRRERATLGLPHEIERQ
jgi:hypothetical protein